MKRNLLIAPIMALMLVGCGDLVTDTNSTTIDQPVSNIDGFENSVKDVNITTTNKDVSSIDENISNTDEVIEKPSEVVVTKNALSYYGIDMFTELDDNWTDPLIDGSWSVWSKDIDNFNAIAVTYEGVGVVKIALIETYSNDEYGITGKSKFKDFKESLDAKYVKVDEYDFCIGSDYVCESSNFSYSLYLGDRVLDSYYTDEHNTSITLSLEKGRYTSDTRIRLVYQTQKFSDLKKEEDEAVSSKL